ncbi:hypothetical protein [Streptomyces avicenniae]|uniref:hypothetical protein n=1 Tax=Streptomyces avicenniae TaxID=500153 RepID=UPI00069C939B|nr:hypothetical protein [Streptomyces avicenniae]
MVRETVQDAEDTAEGAAEAAPPPAAAAPPRATAPPEAPGGPGTAGGNKKTSSWFEPRKTTPPLRADTPPGGHPVVGDTPPAGVPDARSASGAATGQTPVVPPRSVTDTGPNPLFGHTEPDHGPGTGPNPLLSGDTPVEHEPRVPRNPWYPEHPETPADGVPHLPPRPVGATSGPVTGTMPLPRRQPVRPEDEDPTGTTMDLGGPFPPAPPAGIADLESTGRMAPITDADRPAPPRTPGQGPGGGAAPPPAEPARKAAPPPAQPAARKRGRSKVKLLAVGLVGIGVIAYGAGLFLSPADVPQGTTVLGIDIGGLTTQEAQNQLESSLEAANNEPLVLRLGDQEVELKPSVAGLAVDAEATAAAVSGQDYSPVAVYGSLFGAERTRDAVVAVDREKLTVALRDLTEGVGSGPVNGSITFTSDGPIADTGRPGMGVDAEAAADAVEAAFRDRAAGTGDGVVELPLIEQQPEIGEEQVRAAMADFAEPAMSGLVTVVAGDLSIDFSPENSIHQFLGMAPANGTLVDTYDLDALAALYGSLFDGVLVTRGDGSQTPVSPEDVAGALRLALRETDPEARVAVVELDAN